MPTYEITGPDGHTYQVSAPEHADQNEILRYAQEQFKGQNLKGAQQTNPADNPTSTMSAFDRTAAGAGGAMKDALLGGQQATLEADKKFAGGRISGLINALRGTVGMEPKTLDSVNQEIVDKRAIDKPLLDATAGKVGNVIGGAATTLPAMLVPGANTVKGAAILNAGLGAIQPTAGDESRLENAAIGAASGAAGQVGANALSRVVSPQSSKYVQLLRNEGITPTPGQMLGGTAQKIEDKLTSVPILGDAINYSRKQGLDEFNRAALARALDPIKAQASTIGREGVQEASDKLSSAYNNLLPKMRLDLDPQLGQELAKIQAMAHAGMLPERAKQLDNILSDQFMRKLTPAGTMSGTSFKEVESQLGRMAKEFGSSVDADQRQMGSALNEALSSMRDSLSRSNPSNAAELAKINEGYANYARIRDAASRQGSAEGVFTPAQLAAAVRSADKSVDKGNYARGTALMEDLSDAGKNVLAPKYPDSGTTGRTLMNLGVVGSGAMSPAIPGALVAASTPYLPVGRKLAAMLAADRPEVAKIIAPLVKRLGPIAGAALLTNAEQQ